MYSKARDTTHDPLMTYALECSHLSKAFNGQPAVQDVDLQVLPGELVTLLGASGCGKTTTLRLIAGFEWPDTGTIIINGRLVAEDTLRIPAEDRRVGMVFQEYALFPHLSVGDNVAFGVRGKAHEKQQRSQEMLTLVGLETLEKRMPYELSGGQQQRVALARALAPRPDVLLLDEPFSNLDAALRAHVRAEIRQILKKSGITCIFVTHDQEEALSLSDRVAVMFDGRIAQIGTPQQLYHEPINKAVARFVGESNFLEAQAEGMIAQSVIGTLPLAEATQGAVELMIRPEALHLLQNGAHNLPQAQVIWREFYGHDQRVGLTLEDGTALIARVDAAQSFTAGEIVGVEVNAPLRVFPRRTDGN